MKFQTWLRTIILVGIALFVLVLVIGGIVALFRNGGFFSLFSGISLSSERLSAAVSPSTANSEDKIAVTWTHEKKSRDGIYEFSYTCLPDVNLSTEANDAIPCNAALPISRNSVTVIPHLSGNAPIDLPITITFTPEGASRVALSSTAILTVNPKPATQPPQATTTPKTGPSAGGSAGTLTPGERKTKIYETGGTGITPNPNGYPDLAIDVVGIGYLSGDTFIPASSVSRNQRAAIVFDVKNIGTNTSPEWNFSASLPVPGGNFTSETEPQIRPGEKIRFTLGFDNLNNSGANTARILVDPQGRIFRDPNRFNNEATVTIFRSN